MKGYTREALYDSTHIHPARSVALERVAFCVEKLAQDTTTPIGAEVVRGLTFEELIGALIAAESHLKMSEDEEEYGWRHHRDL